MSRYCDLPHCVRTAPHQHTVTPPQSALERSVSDDESVSSRNTPPNGTGAQERDPLTKAVDDLAMRVDMRLRDDAPPLIPENRKTLSITSTAPKTEVDGAAAPEVEAGGASETSAWAPRWEDLTGQVERAETELAGARERRLRLLEEMKAAGLSLADIAAVTGLSRQRIGQLLR